MRKHPNYYLRAIVPGISQTLNLMAALQNFGRDQHHPVVFS